MKESLQLTTKMDEVIINNATQCANPKNMKIKTWLAVPLVALLSWTALTNLVDFTKEHSVQQQALVKIKPLLAEAVNYNTLDINSLNATQTKLKQTISTLEKIPNLPGFAYQQAQNNLAQLRPLLGTIESKLKTEEQASANLESARHLNTEAVKLVIKPYSVEGWQQAKNKWQQALKLLESIPAGTFVSAQAKDGLATCRLGYTAVTEKITVENKAVKHLKSATEVAQKAVSMTTDSPYQMKDLLNAQPQWQLATNLLSSIPSGTTVSTAAEEQFIYYRNNLQSINDALNQMKQCMAQSSYTEVSCGYDVAVNIVTPPIATASNSDSQDDSEPSSYSDSNTEIDNSSLASSYNNSSDSSSSGSCDYSWQTDSAGHSCGNRAASVRLGGRLGGTGSYSSISSYSGRKSGSTYVRGYTRSNGTYVRSHYRRR